MKDFSDRKYLNVKQVSLVSRQEDSRKFHVQGDLYDINGQVVSSPSFVVEIPLYRSITSARKGIQRRISKAAGAESGWFSKKIIEFVINEVM